jgi:hypothetical protein
MLMNAYSCGILWQLKMNQISYSGSGSQVRKKISKRVALFGICLLVVLVLLGGLGYFVTRGSKKPEVKKTIALPTSSPTTAFETETPTPTPAKSKSPTLTLAPTKAKTPTSAPSSAKSSIKVSILNGSGESGVAAKASSILKAAGYSVVSTGNADNYDYKDVTIQTKASEKQILSELKSDLSSDYTIGDATSDLSEGQTYDVLVIIGK